MQAARVRPANCKSLGSDDGEQGASLQQQPPDAEVLPPPPPPPPPPLLPPAEPLAIELEILAIALPTLATLAADPVAGLVSTAYVGRLPGAAPLASVGVALSVYGSVTKLLNMPLLAVTTSSVAQALGVEQGGRAGGGVGG